MNPWEIVGSGLRQTAGDLGQFQKGRQGYQDMVQRRMEAMREAQIAEERRMLQDKEDKRQEAEEKRRQEEYDAKKNKPAEWKPSTRQEKIDYEAELAAAKNRGHGPSPADKNRLMERDNARKRLPSTWMALDKLWGQRPKQTPDMLPEDFAKSDDAWKRRMETVRGAIQDLQGKAGEQITSDPFSTEREQSPSWLSYAQGAYPGKYPDDPEATATHGQGAAPSRGAPAQPVDEVAAAEDWLAKNPNHPLAGQVKAKLDSLRGARGF